MRIRRLHLFAAAALVASAGLAAPAPLASPAAHFRPGSWRFHRSLASPRAHAAAAKSSHFAAYSWNSNDSISSAMGTSTSFVVPHVKGCTTTATGIFPDAGLETPGGISAAGLFVGCSGGKALYYPMLVINNSVHRFKSMHAKPGDVIVITTAENGSTTKVSLKDKTRKGVSKTLSGAGSNAFGGVVAFPWIGDLALPPFSGSHEPVPNFGMISFSGSQIDGLPLGSFRFDGLTGYDLYTTVTPSTREVSTGNLDSSGESFKTTFKAP